VREGGKRAAGGDGPEELGHGGEKKKGKKEGRWAGPRVEVRWVCFFLFLFLQKLF
jgi:hypothetical protein